MRKRKQEHSLSEFIQNVIHRPKGAKGKYEIKKSRRKYVTPRKEK